MTHGEIAQEISNQAGNMIALLEAEMEKLEAEKRDDSDGYDDMNELQGMLLRVQRRSARMLKRHA